MLKYPPTKLQTLAPTLKAGPLTDIALRLVGAGAAALTLAAADNPPGASCTRTSEGLYVITLPGRGALDILNVQLTVLSASRIVAYVTAISESARTITVTTKIETDGTVEDLASGTEVLFLRALVRG